MAEVKRRRPLWTFIPSLILTTVTLPVGIYQIGKFALSSWRGAAIVAACFAIWLTGSLIWVHKIYPRLQARKKSAQ